MSASRPVRELVEDSDLVRCSPESSVAEAAAMMAEGRCGSILVIKGERLEGIFTERDLLNRVVAKRLDPAATPLAQVMTREPDTIAADAPLADVIRMMDEFSYRYLPVMEGGRIIGVVSTRHLPFTDVIEMASELAERHALTEHMR
jgi:CBS domain-containing protein